MNQYRAGAINVQSRARADSAHDETAAA